MRLTKMFLMPVFGVSLIVLQGVANAALVDVCTYLEGCGPDFAATNGTASYNPVTDEFKYTTTNMANVHFVAGANQIDQTAQEATSLTVSGATAGGVTGELLEVIFHVDSSGVLFGSSSVNVNGRIVYFDPGLPGLASITANGNALNGALVKDGVVDEISAASGTNVLLFTGTAGAGGILAANGMSGLAGEIALFNGDTFDWSSSWTSTGASINLVAPVPASLWLFMSGLFALVSFSKRKFGLVV